MLRATLVELEDGLVAEPLAGKGRLVARADATRYDTMHAHCDVLVVGARARRAARPRRDGRVILAVPRRWTSRSTASARARADDGRSGSTTATTRSRSSAAGGSGGSGRSGSCSRPARSSGRASSPTTTGPGRCSRAPSRRTASPTGVTAGLAAAGARASTSGARRGGAASLGRPHRRAGARRRAARRSSASAALTGAGLPDAPPFALPDGDEDAMFVDLERDSTVADIRRAIGAGLRSVEHVKRYTTIGTGSDQGKTRERERDPRRRRAARRRTPASSGRPPSARPTCRSPFALLAGRDRGALFDPVRVTPIHAWHVAHGAVFEDVGQWKRPRYFPRAGEDDGRGRPPRVRRRARVASRMMDATTLGKIDVQGPDAVEFLNRIYTNAFDSLAVGMCRYARHVQGRRHGLRRRRRHARRRGAVRLHDDDRQRRAGARVDGGVAADRVAASCASG